MLRSGFFALLITAIAATSSPAQDWAKKMFETTEHDFGTVAKNAKSEYRFKFVNKYVEDLHISDVTTSCHCTDPSLANNKHDFKTWETGEIIAHFNTDRFVGDRHATLTVTIDKPFRATVQLNIKGTIRSDVVFTPGAVDFGSVDLGAGATKTVSVLRYNRSDWKILDVKSANTNFEVEVLKKNGGSNSGQTAYDLRVHLKPETPPGYLADPLVLITNDSSATQIPIDVQGVVVSDLTASLRPLGTVARGETTPPQNLVIRSKKQPFRIINIEAGDGFTLEMPKSDESRMLFLIPVTFTGADRPGKVSQRLRIQTDIGKGAIIEVTAEAEVVTATGAATATAEK